MGAARDSTVINLRRTFVNRNVAVKSVSLAAALLLAGTLPAEAQQSEIAALRQQIADLTERLNNLEGVSK